MSFKTKIKNFDLSRKFLDFLKILHVPYQVCVPLFDLYHKYVMTHLNKWFILASKYTNNKKIEIENNNRRNKKIIWTFWWQGSQSMPDIVKMCLKSVFNHSSGHRVVFITKNNVKKYAKLPRYIYALVNKGNITLTNFSDILEFNLLRNYGGLWIDATVYCIKDLSSICFDNLYTASGGYDRYHSNISKGHWTGFLFGGDVGQPLFIYMDEFFKMYWKHNKYLFDYFLIDDALKYAYDNNIGKFNDYVTKHVKAVPYIFYMQHYLNKVYNYNIYKKFVSNAPLFKLTYKMNLKGKKNTLYNILLKKNNI